MNNRFTTVQSTDRTASKRFLAKLCLRYNVSGETALSALERKCKAAVVFLDREGYIKYVSPNIINKDYNVAVLMNGEKQMFLGKLKGLCRVDLPKLIVVD